MIDHYKQCTICGTRKKYKRHIDWDNYTSRNNILLYETDDGIPVYSQDYCGYCAKNKANKYKEMAVDR